MTAYDLIAAAMNEARRLVQRTSIRHRVHVIGGALYVTEVDR